MQTQRLTFAQMQQEFEAIPQVSLGSIKGGVDETTSAPVTAWISQMLGVNVISGYDEEGFWAIKTSMEGNWIRVNFSLQEVEIIGYGTYLKPPQFVYNESPFGPGWTSNETSGGGGSYGGGDTNLQDKFMTLLSATGTTASAFGNVAADIHSIAKVGDFAAEAKTLLKSMSRYSGAIGTAIDVITSAVEMFEDGTLTLDEASGFIANQIIGGTLGSIPFAGGVLATIYDLSGGDDYVKAQIQELIEKYFNNYVLVS